MDNSRFERVRSLFAEAVQRPRDTRRDYVRRACLDDPSVSSEVIALLDHCSSDTGQQTGSSSIDTPERTWRRPASAGSSFSGTERFVPRRTLGAGGFGVVYEVYDRLKDQTVALKTLHNLTADSLYRLKREFRSLADVSHPNLIQLFELGSQGDQWFFTMELIDGVNFIQYTSAPTNAGSVTEREPRNFAMARDALSQLAAGLQALHESGHVHRDVKPSNVLVTGEGRVVLLDFGLILDVDREAGLQSMIIAGTPIYMSPEQAAGLSLTAASDWYSVGAMFYQVLTGKPPFVGGYLEVLRRKQGEDPPAPRTVADEVPDDLNDLCMRLIARDASARPTGSEILSALSPHPSLASTPSARALRTRPFVGREQQLAALDRALRDVLDGACEIRRIHGTSGIGKSALIRAFLDLVEHDHHDAVILTGRCYERESVPYKGLDNLIDMLARYMQRLPAHEAEAVLPRGFGALAQLFPVLRDLQRAGARPAAVPADAQELRRRAFTALRELLGRIADKHPLILAIDDVQWGDLDSAAVLSEVVRTPDAPAALLLVSYRDEEVETSPFLDVFLHDESIRDRAQALAVEPLSESDARLLTARLLAGHVEADLNPTAVVSESGGSPFFINELVRFAESIGPHDAITTTAPSPDTSAREANLAHMIHIRLSRLPESAQQVLHVIAINGRPVPEAVLKHAAGPFSEAVLALLRSERLVRGRNTSSGVEFEVYHDRIRELIVAAFSLDERRALHVRLLDAFETRGSVSDAELLAEHSFEAGNTAKAFRYAVRAAGQAADALAFERAARLYRRALDWNAPDSERGPLLRKLGDALRNAGRGPESAESYLAAAELLPAEALPLKQQAAQQLLFAGHTDAGLSVIREVLRMVGMRLPTSTAATMASLMFGRLRVRLRGLRFIERAASDIQPADLMRVDACWSVSGGLSLADTLRGATFQTRHLLMALRCGEIDRVNRALCTEMAFVAMAGTRATKRVNELCQQAAALSQRVATPYAEAIFLLARGIASYLRGDWTAAARTLATAEDILSNRCTGVQWELDNARFYGVWSTYEMGDAKQVAARLPFLSRDAEERGDAMASAFFNGLVAHFHHCALDDPETAGSATEAALARWHQGDIHLTRLWRAWTSANVTLYLGQPRKAWHDVDGSWNFLRRSPLYRVQMMRITLLELRARAALGAARQLPSQRSELTHVARRCSDSIAQEHAPWGDPLVHMIRAGIDFCFDAPAPAISHLALAERAFEQVDMRLWRAVALYARGRLVSELDGAPLLAQAAAQMTELGIRNPAAMARMFAPWLFTDA